jgi:hypothetical protein
MMNADIIGDKDLSAVYELVLGFTWLAGFLDLARDSTSTTSDLAPIVCDRISWKQFSL